MAIYTQYGSECNVIGPMGSDGTLWIKRLKDGVEFNVPTLSLKADGGIQEIEREAKKYGDQSPKGAPCSSL